MGLLRAEGVRGDSKEVGARGDEGEEGEEAAASSPNVESRERGGSARGLIQTLTAWAMVRTRTGGRRRLQAAGGLGAGGVMIRGRDPSLGSEEWRTTRRWLRLNLEQLPALSGPAWPRAELPIPHSFRPHPTRASLAHPAYPAHA